jgi:hypothetical protein
LLYLAGFIETVIVKIEIMGVHPGSSTGILGRAIGTAIFLGGVRAAFYANREEDPDATAQVANPPMDTTGMSRFSLIIEVLPQRAWPYVRIPFLLMLVVGTALALIGLTTSALNALRPAVTE